MFNAVTTCLSKYAIFSGRAGRSEYWYFYLLYVIIYVLRTIIGGRIAVLLLGVGLVLLMPLLAVSWRRMHDTNRPGWFSLIPVYGHVLTFFKSDPNVNKYDALTTR